MNLTANDNISAVIYKDSKIFSSRRNLTIEQAFIIFSRTPEPNESCAVYHLGSNTTFSIEQRIKTKEQDAELLQQFEVMNTLSEKMAEFTHFQMNLFFKINKQEFSHWNFLRTVSEWAAEFHVMYYPAIEDWKTFELSTANIYNSRSFNHFISAWTAVRFEQYRYEFPAPDRSNNS